ncbi:hypothetical protein CYY_006753 [Polysphondylium violaceum]|uniref:Uncharacterized protein n=1 Tax=Polysphondylium violaceum TaxID=133409 RepID=A0A8J4UYS2_9MYCE|nr:hypothetical protein CYY_006753 [Polysphondylium violaceum]
MRNSLKRGHDSIEVQLDPDSQGIPPTPYKRGGDRRRSKFPDNAVKYLVELAILFGKDIREIMSHAPFKNANFSERQLYDKVRALRKNGSIPNNPTLDRKRKAIGELGLGEQYLYFKPRAREYRHGGANTNNDDEDEEDEEEEEDEGEEQEDNAKATQETKEDEFEESPWEETESEASDSSEDSHTEQPNSSTLATTNGARLTQQTPAPSTPTITTTRRYAPRNRPDINSPPATPSQPLPSQHHTLNSNISTQSKLQPTLTKSTTPKVYTPLTTPTAGDHPSQPLSHAMISPSSELTSTTYSQQKPIGSILGSSPHSSHQFKSTSINTSAPIFSPFKPSSSLSSYTSNLFSNSSSTNTSTTNSPISNITSYHTIIAHPNTQSFFKYETSNNLVIYYPFITKDKNMSYIFEHDILTVTISCPNIFSWIKEKKQEQDIKEDTILKIEFYHPGKGYGPPRKINELPSNIDGIGFIFEKIKDGNVDLDIHNL